MKHSFPCGALLVCLLLLIIFSEASSARFLHNKQGENVLDLDEINNKASLAEMGDTDSFDNLMGKEDCGSEDEECLKRRVLADAHLDYIYTQNHKAP